MKVILQKPVDKLGDPGDVVEVADGYARNYLIPRSMAVRAHKGAVQQAENLRRAHERRQYARKGEFEAIASRLISGGPILVKARAGEEGKLFGSVTAEHIAAAIAASTRASRSTSATCTSTSRSVRSAPTRCGCTCSIRSTPSSPSRSWPEG